MFFAFFFSHSSTAARMPHPTERCRSLANFSKPWSCSALSRILKISILMYDSVLHNDYRCQPQIATTAKCHSLTSPLKEEDCARARFTFVHRWNVASWVRRSVVSTFPLAPGDAPLTRALRSSELTAALQRDF